MALSVDVSNSMKRDRSRGFGAASWLFVVLMLCFVPFGRAADDEVDPHNDVLAVTNSVVDPESVEGDFEERAKAIQSWLQMRELERIDMGLSHQYDRPRDIDEDEYGDTSKVPALRWFRRSGRDLFVRLRQPYARNGGTMNSVAKHGVETRKHRGKKGAMPTSVKSAAVSRRPNPSAAKPSKHRDTGQSARSRQSSSHSQSKPKTSAKRPAKRH
jgi:hypothetical protein